MLPCPGLEGYSYSVLRTREHTTFRTGVLHTGCTSMFFSQHDLVSAKILEYVHTIGTLGLPLSLPCIFAKYVNQLEFYDYVKCNK